MQRESSEAPRRRRGPTHTVFGARPAPVPAVVSLDWPLRPPGPRMASAGSTTPRRVRAFKGSPTHPAAPGMGSWIQRVHERPWRLWIGSPRPPDWPWECGESSSSNGQGSRNRDRHHGADASGVSGVASSTQGHGVLWASDLHFRPDLRRLRRGRVQCGHRRLRGCHLTAGAALGMWAQANGVDGSGVYGSASGSGSSVGVRGRSFGTASAASGVIGELTNTTGTGAAVLGIQGCRRPPARLSSPGAWP